MSPRRTVRRFVTLLMLGVALPTTTRAGTESSRVLLDRLTWSPDGRHLAVEARSGRPGHEDIDTLIVDLSRGALSERHPRAGLAAFHPAGDRMAVITRYALHVGVASAPREMTVLARLDPSLQPLRQLAFSTDGDSLFARREVPGFDEIVAFDLASGRETLNYRISRQAESRALWDSIASGGMTPVEPVPFGSIYLRIGQGLFFLERSTTEVTGLEGHWLYDLHFRNERDDTEVLLTRSFVPFLTLVSPDSSWLAIAGNTARPDYGGGLNPELMIISTDGSTAYTVHPEGAPAASVDVRAIAWSGHGLWYTSPGGLYRVDPEVGRARNVPIGPAPPAWSDSLAGIMVAASLVFTAEWPGTAAAVPLRDELRHAGLPAWIAPAPEGSSGFRVAVGAAAESADLESWGAELTRLGFQDFEVRTVEAAAAGIPFPYGAIRGPDHREAFLVAVGSPGRRAQELWITEKNGARQVRLIRAVGAGSD